MTTQESELKRLEDELRRVGTVPDPTQIKVGDVAFAGDENYPIRMTISEIDDAGWWPIYHTVTRDVRVVNKNMLSAIMRKRLPGGALAFTLIKPAEPPVVGDHLCWLHPDHPKRKIADELFLGQCNISGRQAKHNIPNEGEVKSHMQKKHKVEYARLEEYEADLKEAAKEQTQKDFNDALLAAMGNRPTAGAATAVAERPSKPPRSRKNGKTRAKALCDQGCGKPVKNQALHDRNSHG